LTAVAADRAASVDAADSAAIRPRADARKAHLKSAQAVTAIPSDVVAVITALCRRADAIAAGVHNLCVRDLVKIARVPGESSLLGVRALREERVVQVGLVERCGALGGIQGDIGTQPAPVLSRRADLQRGRLTQVWWVALGIVPDRPTAAAVLG